jgi:hypothetical protein
MGDILGDLEEMDKEGASEAPMRRDSKGRILPKAAPKDEPVAAEPKSGDEPVKPGEEPAKPADEPKPGTMRALGKAYDALKKERDEVLQPELQSLRAAKAEHERAITELRSRQPDVAPLQAQLKSLQAENARLQETVQYTAYKESKEYLDTYRKPLDDEWASTAQDIDGFMVELADGSSRPVTTSDIMRLGDASLNGKQRQDLAREWFGDSAAAILTHVNNLRHLSVKEAAAVADAKTKAKDRQSQMSLARMQHDTALGAEYAKSQTELAAKYPKWFGTDPADAPGNELLTKGFQYADAVFANAPVKQENGQMAPLTPQQRVKRLAVIRAKAANHDRLAARVKARNARIAELEADLAEYEKSGGGTGTAGEPGRNGTKDFMGTIEDEIKALERR